VSFDRTEGGHRFALRKDVRARRGMSCVKTVCVAILFLIGSAVIAGAATIEEVARCRTIQNNTQRWDCFKSLKAKREVTPKANREDIPSPILRDVQENAPDDPASNSSIDRLSANSAATNQEVARCRAIRNDIQRSTCFHSSNTKREATLPPIPSKVEEPAPASTSAIDHLNADSLDTKRAASPPPIPSKAEEPAPASTSAIDHLNADSLDTKRAASPPPIPSKAEEPAPASTSAIDHISAAPGQPLCVDQDALAAMLIADVLASNPAQTITNGCQTIPEDAQVELLQHYSSGFHFLRVVKVKVTSPTQQDPTVGYTVEIGR
jgi:hypothetical protein